MTRAILVGVVLFAAGSAYAQEPPPPEAPAPETPAPEPEATPEATPGERKVSLPPAAFIRESVLVMTYAKTARDAARNANCDVALVLIHKVQALDPVFYDTLFSVEPYIAACIAGIPVSRVQPPRPPQVQLQLHPRAQVRRPREHPEYYTPPASGSRYLGEVIIGALTGGGGAAIGALLGAGLCIGDDGDDGCDTSIQGGAYVASIIAAPFGVYVIGASGDEAGSLGYTFLGSVLGGAGGLALLATDNDEVALLGMIGGPLLGSIIGFNSTRRYRPRRHPPSYGSLLRVRDGRAELGIPLVTRATTSDRTVTSVPLLGGTF